MPPESEAKKAWMRANTTVVSVKFTHNTEKDMLDFLQGKQTATVIKAALREYMERHDNE